MKTTYSVTLDVEVHDPKALFDACMATAAEQSVTEDELRDILLDDEGEILVTECLRWIADPGISWDGCDIQDSSCEVF